VGQYLATGLVFAVPAHTCHSVVWQILRPHMLLSLLCFCAQISACNYCSASSEPLTAIDSIKRGVHFSRPSSWMLAAAGDDLGGSTSGSEEQDGQEHETAAALPLRADGPMDPQMAAKASKTTQQQPTWSRKQKPPRPPPIRPVRPAPPVLRPRANPFDCEDAPPLPAATVVVVVPSDMGSGDGGCTMRVEHVLSGLSSADEAEAVSIPSP